ncbi:MAG TPA: hypothetical protein VIA18_04645 [Polyangia bacterium]|nr:hypothetical protein [Polyangia bacterium]
MNRALAGDLVLMQNKGCPALMTALRHFRAALLRIVTFVCSFEDRAITVFCRHGASAESSLKHSAACVLIFLFDQSSRGVMALLDDSRAANGVGARRSSRDRGRQPLAIPPATSAVAFVGGCTKSRSLVVGPFFQGANATFMSAASTFNTERDWRKQ